LSMEGRMDRPSENWCDPEAVGDHLLTWWVNNPGFPSGGEGTAGRARTLEIVAKRRDCRFALERRVDMLRT
jgi:hypothetical protein